MHRNKVFGLVLPGPAGGTYSAPQTLAAFKGVEWEEIGKEEWGYMAEQGRKGEGKTELVLR